MNRVDVIQPVLFALMVSLAALWRSHGVVPSAVVGHSQGEIAAACVAGALTLEDAAKVVALRARTVIDLPGRCGMGFVSATADVVEKMLERWSGSLGVAAINSPRSLVVAGDREALEDFLDLCDDEGMRSGRVAADYASHSPQVEAVREKLIAELKGVRPSDAEVPIYSTVTADWVDGSDLDARYWYKNLRRPVRFHDAVRGLLDEGYTGSQISPHPVLTIAMQQTAEAEGAELRVTATLRRDESDRNRFTLRSPTPPSRACPSTGRRSSRRPARGRSSCPRTRSSGSGTGCPRAGRAPATSPRSGSPRAGTRSRAPRSRCPTATVSSCPAASGSTRTPGSPTTPSWARSSCRARRCWSWSPTRAPGWTAAWSRS